MNVVLFTSADQFYKVQSFLVNPGFPRLYAFLDLMGFWHLNICDIGFTELCCPNGGWEQVERRRINTNSKIR